VNFDVIKDFTRVWVEDYAKFIETRMAPPSKQEIYQLLAVWSLANPMADVNRTQHLQQLFTHAKWPSRNQARAFIEGLEADGLAGDIGESLRTIVAGHFTPVRRPQPSQHQGAISL
jgi:hypothetical protein